MATEVFQDFPQNLKNQIYGVSGSQLKAVQTDSTGNLQVGGSLTSVGTITNPVSVSTVGTITNPITVASVTSPLTVSSITNPINVTAVGTITNPVSVSSVASITNPIGVTSITNPVTVQSGATAVSVKTQGSDTVAVTGTVAISNTGGLTFVHSFLNVGPTSLSATTTTQFTTGQDISQLSTYTFFIQNLISSVNDVTVSIQLSPNNIIWVDDANPKATLTFAPGESGMISTGRFLNYMRLTYESSGTASINVWFQAQS